MLGRLPRRSSARPVSHGPLFGGQLRNSIHGAGQNVGLEKIAAECQREWTVAEGGVGSSHSDVSNYRLKPVQNSRRIVFDQFQSGIT